MSEPKDDRAFQHRMAALSDVSKTFSEAIFSYEQLVDTISVKASELTGDACHVGILTEDGHAIMTIAVHHPIPMIKQLLTASKDRASLNDVGIAKPVLEEGKIVRTIITPGQLPSNSSSELRELVEKHIKNVSLLVVPLLARGRVIGGLSFTRFDLTKGPHTEDDEYFAKDLADRAALAVDNARLFQAMQREIEEHKRTEAALRASEHSHRMFFENNPVPLIVFDPLTLQLIAVNEAALALYGYSKEEFLTLLLSDLRVKNQVLVKEYKGDWQGVTQHRKKDGVVMEIEVSARTIQFSGKSCRLVALKDITAHKRVEEQLKQSQKMDAIGRLAGGIAHDFNNILSVILCCGEIVLSELAEVDPLHEAVEDILKSAKKAANLTHQLLLFSRHQVVEPKIVDLNDLVGQLEKMLLRILGEDIAFTFIHNPLLGKVKVDPGNIEQVVMNLVINARDAMPKGGQLTIELSNIVLSKEFSELHLGTKPGQYVMMAITDTGIGMDQTTLGQIFEPFFTTKEKTKGTGLGLATVFGIVQQSGGNIWVYSEPKRGTTFKIYLPRVDGVVESIRPMSTPGTLRGTETILIVEDEDQVRHVAMQILRNYGYHVIEARNAGEALLTCEKHAAPIHLLLSDVVMPQMSGPELAARLASVRPGMKVLCMSGYTDDSIVRHGVLDSKIAFLQKPLTPESLTRKVREILDS